MVMITPRVKLRENSPVDKISRMTTIEGGMEDFNFGKYSIK